ncbi:hypothetical protein NBRC111894_2049 [Sporolactobacillus inulinus]|uniref:Uncharacterized protein n=1 Tax=Sporolactobacillus inulinus TaxID=2078 RepID=A0A4Y1ZBQ3_9BACL|nr:hypothetical protein NBRC111894_2049 [Sporolactobacillus inulinus]
MGLKGKLKQFFDLEETVDSSEDFAAATVDKEKAKPVQNQRSVEKTEKSLRYRTFISKPRSCLLNRSVLKRLKRLLLT